MHRISTLATFSFTVLIMGSSAVALADEPPAREHNKKSSGCSVAAEDNAVIGLAAGVLLLSGVALRRRS
ncbi:hypothetical protein DB30_05898 [Enhygromyxa salina]|uniref:Uncharacterized protein n=1 Tax=Enhygromyxa salina TaxID=215803 RepID=A0A0C1ZW07_9BACT|nr:hypothetical protein [Enhygromyxa salina]KIG15198.1 hypothetical protein DB30_05898 [Enhygromyxa salina]